MLALTTRVCACVCVHGLCVQVPRGSEKDMKAPVVGFAGSYEPSEWVLGTELGASARGVHTLN